LSPHLRARRGIARTFQQPELFAGLSVRQHLVLAWRIHYDRYRLWRDLADPGAARRADPRETERVETLLDITGIRPLQNAPVSALPLGLTRLIEIARALASSPHVVLLDEPFSGLDVSESKHLAASLVSITDAESVSFLLVDHDADTVFALSSSVTVLDFGHVIAQGSPAVVRENDAVKTAYLGEGLASGLEV
jgi:branched-chain amino acid transport system ATP-binding protein